MQGNHKKIIVGQRFRHYRNRKTYVVENIAVNPNTNDTIIVYRDLRFTGVAYFRPLDEFTEKFERLSVSRLATLAPLPL